MAYKTVKIGQNTYKMKPSSNVSCVGCYFKSKDSTCNMGSSVNYPECIGPNGKLYWFVKQSKTK
jgi:hypothetical protein